MYARDGIREVFFFCKKCVARATNGEFCGRHAPKKKEAEKREKCDTRRKSR